MDCKLIFNIYKELIQLNNKKTNNLSKKWAEDLSRHFSKKRHPNGQQTREKMLNITTREMQIKITTRHHLTPIRMFYLCLCSVAQLHLTLCNPMDCRPPGSSVHRIFQARILEWVVISSSRGSFRPRY